MLDFAFFEEYWQGLPLRANLIIGLNLVGALLLGMLVGYERAYHGRAAGMRTYGLVCMASCALTVLVGYASAWYGGQGGPTSPDPTRVLQGVVSGIGFLCAGVIVKDGLNINGLTTAASLWTAAATGIMVGVGFYGAAVTLAGLSMLSMSVGIVIQKRLPSKESLGVMLKFRPGQAPAESVVVSRAMEKGYLAQMSRLAISCEGGMMVWRFPLEAAHPGVRLSRTELARDLAALPYVESFSIEPMRN